MTPSDRAWLTAKKLTPNVCYHAEFGRSALKGEVIDIGEPQNRERLGPAPLLFRCG